MKQYFKSILKSVILLAAVLFTSCEEELTIFKGPYHVRFSSTGSSVNENATAATTVKLHFAGPVPKEAINIEYSVSGGTAGTDFTLTGGSTLTIPAGEFFTSFTVTPINNLTATGNKVVTFEITSVSGGNTAGLGLVGKKFTYTIVDDDCPFETENFTGAYSCDEPGYAVYDVVLEAGDEPNTIVVTNFWDYSNASIVVEFDPNSNVITVPDQPIGLTSSGSPLHAVGSGTYTACNGNFKYDYTVYRKSDGAVFDENTHTYTRK